MFLRMVIPAGICEADLLAEMVALNPFSAKRLVEQLLEQELLVMQVTERQTPGPPSIFGKSRSPVVSHTNSCRPTHMRQCQHMHPIVSLPPGVWLSNYRHVVVMEVLG